MVIDDLRITAGVDDRLLPISLKISFPFPSHFFTTLGPTFTPLLLFYNDIIKSPHHRNNPRFEYKMAGKVQETEEEKELSSVPLYQIKILCPSTIALQKSFRIISSYII